MIEMKGRVALVTGAARGVGARIAEGLGVSSSSIMTGFDALDLAGMSDSAIQRPAGRVEDAVGGTQIVHR